MMLRTKMNGPPHDFIPFILLSSPLSPTTPMQLRLAQRALTIAFALSVLCAGSGWAATPPRSGPRDGGLPASVRRVQRETGGEVLRAQPIERDGREVYRVKVLTPQGRIRVVEEEAQREEPPPPPFLRQAPPPYPRQAPAPPYSQPPRHVPR